MRKPWVIPQHSDPRLLILIFFAAIVYFTLTNPTFARLPSQILASVVTCCALDFFLAQRRTGKNILPISGLVTSIGVFILIDSIFLWPFILASAISILSKHLIKMNGSHIFNPNNFGVLVLALGFPEFISLNIFRWSGSLFWSILLLSLGLIITIYVNRWLVSLSYFLFFVGFAYLRDIFLDHSLFHSCLSLLGPGIQLFAFFMITDPRTSPHRVKHQIVFGLAIAIIDNLLRMQLWKIAPLVSVFFCCLVYALFRSQNLAPPSSPWKIRYA